MSASHVYVVHLKYQERIKFIKYVHVHTTNQQDARIHFSGRQAVKRVKKNRKIGIQSPPLKIGKNRTFVQKIGEK